MKRGKSIVGVIMGSDSDLPIMTRAVKILEKLEIPHEIRILSAHRTPDEMTNYAKTAQKRGIKVIIAGAGGSAHLAGVAAANAPLIPVIGVPIESGALQGTMISLFSIVQMPPGIPVATVGINGAENAGILAAQILAASDIKLSQRLAKYREELAQTVRQKDSKLSKVGPEEYLKLKK